MLITVLNPNTSWDMTGSIERSARAVAGPDTVVRAVCPAMGPASIESHYDEALAVPGLLAEIARGEQLGSDGYVIACFGDPGLDAARELAAGPVVGIAEAAMHAASFLGRGFSVVTTLSQPMAPEISNTLPCEIANDEIEPTFWLPSPSSSVLRTFSAGAVASAT